MEEDLVDVLIRLQEENELNVEDNCIKAIIVEIFIAGSETSSTTVIWAMSEMMKNPGTLQKAQAEVRQVFNRKAKGEIDQSDINELSYLKLVIKETFRLHPPATLMAPRESREKCEINGYEIPKGTKAFVNAWAIGRDPEYWNDAESFKPERFEDLAVNYKGNNFEFIPFGAGKRICPGMSLGLANIELPLAQLLYNFDWKLANGLKPEELDMTELFGATVGRKSNLLLIPTPYFYQP
ncbi:Cytochrome p450 [Thalictrum thalictroides]|uniref:Cytochrome p450 n=1 Tax=Thalictrum thalictroides TaxID=46969 RepID=A0A7J6WE87_THATH|nr:Cytochrome p450 [Thalictrum thalictroides]